MDNMHNLIPPKNMAEQANYLFLTIK